MNIRFRLTEELARFSPCSLVLPIIPMFGGESEIYELKMSHHDFLQKKFPSDFLKEHHILFFEQNCGCKYYSIIDKVRRIWSLKAIAKVVFACIVFKNRIHDLYKPNGKYYHEARTRFYETIR